MATSRSLAALLLLMVAAVSMIASSSAYQYQEDSVGSTFFLEKDLYPGSKMTLHFTGAATSPKLPRARADSIPFSSAKIPEILSLFSIKPTSPAAAAVRSTLAECEAPRVPGVAAQRCATSVESMVDFAATNLRTRNIRAGTTKLSKAGPTRRQAYAVESVRPLHVAGRDMVACHCMPYPYAVFGCHTTTATVYTVVLAGAADGTRAEALAACHLDATPGIGIWAYQKLGVVRGQVAVCHFLPQDSMLWMRK